MSATKSFGVAMMILAVFSMALTAQATTITNVTTSTVVFSDDYEGLGTSVSHAVPYQNDGDFDPVAGVGSWTVDEVTSHFIQVTDSVLGTDPGASQGDNYLRVLRTGDNNVAYATLTSPQTTTGDVIHLESMLYVDQLDASPGVASLALYDSGGGILSLTGFEVSGKVQNYLSGWVDTTLTFTPGAWNKVEIDYAVDASTYSMTVNGSTESGLGLYLSGSGGDVDKVRVGSAKRVEYCLDAVPEPSTAILLGIGLLGLLCYAWRKRK